MEVIKTDIEGLFIVKPKVHADSRGYFFESFSQRDFEAATGLHVDFVQDNESSSRRGVVRGLHFQRPPYAQAKLVRCVRGAVVDVAVDIRRGSPTYGRYFAAELTEANKLQLFLPRGMAHGFAVVSPEAVFQYKCDAYYEPRSEGGIDAFDPAIGIDWPVGPDEIVLSEKDRHHPLLADFESPFLFIPPPHTTNPR